MRGLKNVIFSGLIVLIALTLTNVNASYAYKWTVNGNSLSLGGVSKDASWLTNDNYTGGVLTLNNYDGGQLKIECVGTGLEGQVFAIKLVGDNKITVANGVGIVANEKIVFIGDGKLTIDAAIPIGSGSIVNADNTLTAIENGKYNKSTTIVIQPTLATAKEEAKEEPQKLDEVEKTSSNEVVSTDSKSLTDHIKDNLILYMIFGLYGLISLVVIIVLIIKLSKKNKEVI